MVTGGGDTELTTAMRGRTSLRDGKSESERVLTRRVTKTEDREGVVVSLIDSEREQGYAWLRDRRIELLQAC